MCKALKKIKVKKHPKKVGHRNFSARVPIYRKKVAISQKK
jgi:hypothetical protein